MTSRWYRLGFATMNVVGALLLIWLTHNILHIQNVVPVLVVFLGIICYRNGPATSK